MSQYLKPLAPLRLNRLALLVFGFGGMSVAQKGLALLISTQAIALLGASGFGRYAYVLNLVTLATMLVQLGFPQLLVREIAVSTAHNEKAQLSGIIKFAVGAVFAALLLSAILTTLAFNHLGIQANDKHANLWLSGFVLLIAMTAVAMQQAILRGVHRVITATWPVMILQPALFLAFLIAFQSISIKPSADSAILFFAFAYFTSSSILQIQILRDRNLKRAIRTPAQYRLKKWLQSLWPFFVIGGLSVLMSRTALLVLGFFVEDQFLGVYSIATQLSMLILLPATLISYIIEPKLAEAYARNESKQMRDLFGKLTFWSAVFSFVGLTIFWMFGEFALHFAFGPEFSTAYEPLIILGIGSAISVGIGPMGIFLSMAGHERDTMIGSILGVLLNICLALMLIPTFGIIGAAAATTISLISMKVAFAWFAYKKLHIAPSIAAMIRPR